FGGQGVLSMGMTLAYAGMVEDKQVAWIPSYGPEMRGGTANCTVIVSDTNVSSPIISSYDTAIVLNQPSLEKFEPKVKSGGILIFESNNILNPPTRKDINVYSIPAAIEANKLGNKKAMNMIILGAYLEKTPIVSVKSIMEGLKKVLPERHHNLLPMNEKALKHGMTLIK
ncbi:MAG: 2-oxoglutarate ferredoxin oxidoreductase subunit gamma, partial [Planctomycetia bacterium]|nr:2-oxoglutarate ferredoxin oxidoreductase subunit gamma [Planctomycetia bacterium]